MYCSCFTSGNAEVNRELMRILQIYYYTMLVFIPSTYPKPRQFEVEWILGCRLLSPWWIYSIPLSTPQCNCFFWGGGRLEGLDAGHKKLQSCKIAEPVLALNLLFNKCGSTSCFAANWTSILLRLLRQLVQSSMAQLQKQKSCQIVTFSAPLEMGSSTKSGPISTEFRSIMKTRKGPLSYPAMLKLSSRSFLLTSLADTPSSVPPKQESQRSARGQDQRNGYKFQILALRSTFYTT